MSDAKNAIEAAITEMQRLQEKVRVLTEALADIINYDGGADNALQDFDVMERAHSALRSSHERHS